MKKGIRVLVMCLIFTMMTGCGGGPSKEKIDEVQGIYSQLVDKHNQVIEVYADVVDASLSQTLDEMADKINSIGQQDVKDLSDSDIDKIIVELQDNLAIYDDILSSIEKITSDAAKGETNSSVSVTIKNNTGIKLAQIYLYPVSQDDKGNNLLEDIEELGAYETLSILNIDMVEGDTIWHLEVSEESGKIIESEDIDFSDYKNGEVTIQMEFSFDEMKGWIEVE